ncbi:MAG: glycosyltransferase family 4 protein [Patescibacteria group bacterium]|jgi:glycosyltransferase involved in cell wall biosynthesis
MKILRIIYDWPPPWDGLAPHPYELTAAQAKMGHKFFIFCGRWPNAGKIEELENVTLVPFYREPFPGTLNITISIWMFFYYLSWRRKNAVDLVHSHGHFAIWIYLYRLLLKKYFPNAKELKTPLVVHFHNTVEGRKQAALKKGSKINPVSKYLSWPLARLSDKWSVRVAEHCIFVSQDTLDDAVKYYGADPKKCSVVESGVNTDIFKSVGVEEKDKTRHELGLDPIDKVVVNHGIMVERKGIHLLVEALNYLPIQYKLLLVGSGNPAYLEKINNRIKELKLVNRVVQVGYTPYPHTPIAFQAADIFVLPSQFEGLPKVLMQSLSCGIPALVSGFKLSEDIRGIVYLENTEPTYIAQKIREIVENPPEVDRSKVVSEYSWEERAYKVEKVYDEILPKGTN